VRVHQQDRALALEAKLPALALEDKLSALALEEEPAALALALEEEPAALALALEVTAYVHAHDDVFYDCDDDACDDASFDVP